MSVPSDPDQNSNAFGGHHSFLDDDGNEHGSFEVWWNDGHLDLGADKGWYWWACFPGCLPDGEATGPFNTSEEAYNHARSE